MHTAAQEMALHSDWKRAADQAGIHPGTARAYKSKYPGWEDLVNYYRQRAFDKRLEEHWHNGTAEVLDALKKQVKHTSRIAEQLEQERPDGVVTEEDVEQVQKLSKAVVYAASQYLEATGRKKYQKTLAKLKAQEDVTGEAGESITLKHALSEEADAEELSQKYRQLVGQAAEE